VAHHPTIRLIALLTFLGLLGFGTVAATGCGAAPGPTPAANPPAPGDGGDGGVTPDGNATNNYNLTVYGFDTMDRQLRVKAPGGTISRLVYGTPGWVKEPVTSRGPPGRARPATTWSR
jgi:hypothetical protein